MEAKLIVVRGNANRREIVLRLPATIGRSRDADLTVCHPSVSRMHCRLLEVGGELIVRDEGSLNGTFIGQARITEAVLRPGGQLTVGPLTFEAVYESARHAEAGGVPETVSFNAPGQPDAGQPETEPLADVVPLFDLLDKAAPEPAQAAPEEPPPGEASAPPVDLVTAAEQPAALEPVFEDPLGNDPSDEGLFEAAPASETPLVETRVVEVPAVFQNSPAQPVFEENPTVNFASLPQEEALARPEPAVGKPSPKTVKKTSWWRFGKKADAEKARSDRQPDAASAASVPPPSRNASSAEESPDQEADLGEFLDGLE
jgi:predicted component of type VI protein secretion system